MKQAGTLYFLQFIAIVIPTSLLMGFTCLLALAAGLGGSQHTLLFTIPLCISGLMGVLGLWRMYFKIYAGMSKQRLQDLPWIQLSAGLIANIGVPLYLLTTIPDFSNALDERIGLLIFLLPSILAIYWARVLTRPLRPPPLSA